LLLIDNREKYLVPGKLISVTEDEQVPPQLNLSPQTLSTTNPPFASQTHDIENEPFFPCQSHLAQLRHCCEE